MSTALFDGCALALGGITLSDAENAPHPITLVLNVNGGEEKQKSYELMSYRGEHIGESLYPLLDAARWLLENNMARFDDRVEIWRDGKLCANGAIGLAATVTIKIPNH